jgi:thiol-disulfide isomerase/thioredoxin
LLTPVLRGKFNMKKIFSIVVLVLAGLGLSGQTKGGYDIKVSIPDIKDSTVYMAYHFGDKQYLKDTLVLDNGGTGSFVGKEPLPQGIYMVVLPGRKYFEFLASDDQIFEISCIYSDFSNTLNFTGSLENSTFVAYQKNWVKMQQKAAALGQRAQNSKQNPDSVRILSGFQSAQEKTMKDYLNSTYEGNRGNILGALVRAMIPIQVPDFQVPAAVKNPDSIKWVRRYNYNKDHFFDNIDLADERLLRTPILQSRFDAFFTGVVIQTPDSVIKEVDKLIKKSEKNYKVFQFVSVYLFNKFRESQIMGHDAVLVKIADEIYLSGKADWVTKEFIEDLDRQVELMRNNLLGMKAQNLVMDSYKGIFVSLYDIEKDFTIVYFWEPNCGHCKEATPKLLSFYEEKAKNESIEVFAVCTTSDKEAWTKYIEENKITWVNGWDPQRSTHFDYYYNVQSTPLIYILDRNKKIIAKKLSIEDVPSFIENYRNYTKASGSR